MFKQLVRVGIQTNLGSLWEMLHLAIYLSNLYTRFEAV